MPIGGWSRTRFRTGSLTVCALLFTSQLWAQTSAADKAAAEALFQQGLELMKAGKVAEACQKLEQSSTIERGIGTSLYLAECYEKAGRTASAWGLFREAASEAQASGETERAAAGRRRADKLEPLLSRLTLGVGTNATIAGFEILRDGSPVQPALWNTAVPVDPGEHRVLARAPGYAEWSAIVKVDPGGASVVSAVPSLTPLPPAAPVTQATATPTSSVVAAPSSSTTAPAQDSGGDHHAGGTQRAAGLVVGGLGIVGLGVGSFFGLRAISKNDDAKQHCPGGGAICTDQEGASLTGEAQDAARLANVLVIGGAILAAGGAALFFTAPSANDTRVGFSMDGRGARVHVGGAF